MDCLENETGQKKKEKRKMLRVFFDDQIFQHQRVGGISRYFCCLAESLARTGEIEVYLYGGWSKNEYLKDVPEVKGLHRIYLPRNPSLKIKSFAYSVSSWYRRRLFSKLKKQGDKIIYHPTFFDLDKDLCAKADATVSTFYDMIPEIFETELSASKKHFELKKAVAESSDSIISISEATKLDMENFYGHEIARKTQVIHLASKLKDEKECKPLELSKPFFMMVGNRHGCKNGMLAIKAFVEYRNGGGQNCLLLCGGQTLSSEEKMALGKHTEATLHVFPKDNEMSFYYKKARALLMPSLYEGFGLPLLEAMERGCPVITTKLSSIPEVAGDAALYVNPYDIEGMKENMESLENEVFRSNLIAKAYERAKLFNWEKVGKKTLKVYKDLFE